MSNSRNPRDTWNALLCNLQTALAEVETHVPIPNATRFQHELLNICRRFQEGDHQRLEGAFYRHHATFIAFIGDLDGSLDLDEPPHLATVFWSVAFSVLKETLRHHCKPEVLGKLLPRLNRALPAFGAQLANFPNDQRVQEPLQRVYQEYIQSYIIMLRQFASHPTPLSFQAFDDRIDPAHALFTASKQEWEEAVQRAQAEENERIAAAASTISVPRDSLGRVHSHAPRLQFETIGSLGDGTYGHVSKVRLINTGTVYAQKVLRVTDRRIKLRIKQQVENEVNIMERLSHLHITKIVFWNYDQDGDFFSIVMLPVAEYNLQQFLQEKCVNASFPRTELAHMTTWFGCLVSALSFAHANDIKHEDIKPGNILIKNHRPFLADFGSAKDFSETGHSTSESIIAYGTPVYWAPEDPPRGRAADVFALGCVFSEMLTVRQGRTLEDYQRARYQRHRDSPYAFRGNLPRVEQWITDLRRKDDRVADLLVEQTTEMLHREYMSRPSAANVKRILMAEYQTVMCTVCSS